MNNLRPRPKNGKDGMKGAMRIFFVITAVLILAVPAVAHVAEWALPAFLSRSSTTAEATLNDFTTFKLEETILIVR